MPVTNVRSKWKNGHLVFESAANNGTVVVPSVSRVHRQSVTTGQVNTGHELLPALPGFRYRIQDMALIAVGGAAQVATSVDIIGVQAASNVKLMDARIAGLTENTLLRAGTVTNGLILAAGASFALCDANTAITIGKTGSNVTTATSFVALLTYTIEEA
jgi:hypothetical protein